MIRIRRGLDLPIAGAPNQSVEAGPPVSTVALLGDDYKGMRPTMAVQVGDRVKLGQKLFEDKKSPGVIFTSPGAGEVAAIHRAEKRRFESIVIRLDGDEQETFDRFDSTELERDVVRDNLVRSGLWTAFRTRPFSKVPALDATPRSIFVTAIDTQPLAPDPAVVLRGKEAEFARGVRILARLTDGPVRICRKAGAPIEPPPGDTIEVHEFDGPHPAGLPGTHIHFLDPVNETKSVWHVGYQDVVAIGHLFATGRLRVDRVVALGGPLICRPRLVTTRLGASVDDLTANQLGDGPVRVVAGSLLDGRTAEAPVAFLGRYQTQVSAVSDETERQTFGWARPGADRFSVMRTFASALLGGTRRFRFTTSSQGDPRAIVPIGSYERVMPLDFVITPLLKSIEVGDIDRAIELGCLELDEDDLALCSFACPSKSDFGPHLRELLTRIEREG